MISFDFSCCVVWLEAFSKFCSLHYPLEFLVLFLHFSAKNLSFRSNRLPRSTPPSSSKSRLSRFISSVGSKFTSNNQQTVVTATVPLGEQIADNSDGDTVCNYHRFSKLKKKSATFWANHNRIVRGKRNKCPTKFTVGCHH